MTRTGDMNDTDPSITWFTALRVNSVVVAAAELAGDAALARQGAAGSRKGSAPHAASLAMGHPALNRLGHLHLFLNIQHTRVQLQACHDVRVSPLHPLPVLEVGLGLAL